MYKDEFETSSVLAFENITTNGALQCVFKTDDVALYNGDCIEVMSYFPDNYVDMVFADPPYNL